MPLLFLEALACVFRDSGLFFWGLALGFWEAFLFLEAFVFFRRYVVGGRGHFVRCPGFLVRVSVLAYHAIPGTLGGIWQCINCHHLKNCKLENTVVFEHVNLSKNTFNLWKSIMNHTLSSQEKSEQFQASENRITTFRLLFARIILSWKICFFSKSLNHDQKWSHWVC